MFPRIRVDPEDGGSSETLVTIYQSTRRRTLGHLNLHKHFRKNLRSRSETSCRLFFAPVDGVFVCDFNVSPFNSSILILATRTDGVERVMFTSDTHIYF